MKGGILQKVGGFSTQVGLNKKVLRRKKEKKVDEKSSKKKQLHVVTWTQEEDDLLRKNIGIHGTKSWGIIASKFKGKSTRQCRRRWFTYLNSNFKKGGWTLEEDMLLCEAQKLFGNRWTEIAKVVSGRTDNAVKNRFSTLRKKTEKYAALEKENFNLNIESNNKRNISNQGYNTYATSESTLPNKKKRSPRIPDDTKMTNSGDRSHLRNATLINQQARAPFAELVQNSNNVNNFPDMHHVFNDKFHSSDQNYKIQLKEDDSKISALIQVIDSGNMDNVWKILQECLNQTDIIKEKIAILQFVSHKGMAEELKNRNERGPLRSRQMEPSKDSPGSSKYSIRSTLLPKSTDDSLKSSLNQDIGAETKAAEFVVKKEVCEVEQDVLPYCEEQINASSKTECFPLQVTPNFRSLAEGITSPLFSESEKSFLRRTLGVESPSMNATFSPFKLPACMRALRYDLR